MLFTRKSAYANGCFGQLSYPDMTIRDFFAMASKELQEQEEELKINNLKKRV